MPAVVRKSGRDMLILKRGAVVEGHVVEENEQTVTFSVDGGTVLFNRNEIQEIRRNIPQ